MEGRTEGAGKESGKNTPARGAVAKDYLAKDFQESLQERKLKARSHSERLPCLCGACVRAASWSVLSSVQ